MSPHIVKCRLQRLIIRSFQTRHHKIWPYLLSTDLHLTLSFVVLPLGETLVWEISSIAYRQTRFKRGVKTQAKCSLKVSECRRKRRKGSWGLPSFALFLILKEEKKTLCLKHVKPLQSPHCSANLRTSQSFFLLWNWFFECELIHVLINRRS